MKQTGIECRIGDGRRVSFATVDEFIEWWERQKEKPQDVRVRCLGSFSREQFLRAIKVLMEGQTTNDDN